jgi:hypothetical protein
MTLPPYLAARPPLPSLAARPPPPSLTDRPPPPSRAAGPSPPSSPPWKGRISGTKTLNQGSSSEMKWGTKRGRGEVERRHTCLRGETVGSASAPHCARVSDLDHAHSIRRPETECLNMSTSTQALFSNWEKTNRSKPKSIKPITIWYQRHVKRLVIKLTRGKHRPHEDKKKQSTKSADR